MTLSVPLLEQLPDAELIALVAERRGRDDRPFSLLFRRHRGYVAQVARRYVPEELIEDVTQDVFVAVHTRLKRFEGRSSFRTWLHTLVVNHCKNTLRGCERRASRETAYERSILGRPDRGVRDIEAGIEAREMSAALSLMPARDREALRLVAIQQRPYSEASRQLGLSISALKMRVARARQALRATLDWSDA